MSYKSFFLNEKQLLAVENYDTLLKAEWPPHTISKYFLYDVTICMLKPT